MNNDSLSTILRERFAAAIDSVASATAKADPAGRASTDAKFGDYQCNASMALARPLVREPDLPRQLERGRRGLVDCVSCNLCLVHEGLDGLRCWRKSWRELAQHARWRLARALSGR